MSIKPGQLHYNLFGARDEGRGGVGVPVARRRLERLNASRMGHHALPPEAITVAVDELTRDRSAMSRFSEQMNLKTN